MPVEGETNEPLLTRPLKHPALFGGRLVVVSSDPESSHFLLQQEGKLVELCYMDSFVELVGLSGSVKDGWCIIAGYIHKRLKKLLLYQFGHLNLKEKLLPEVEEMVNQALSNLRSLSFVEVKQACAEVRSSLDTNFLVQELEVTKYMS